MKFKDLTNQKFNRLTVLKLAPKHKNKIAWLCSCDCGKTIIVLASNLTNNRTRSCGCLKMEKLLQRSTIHNQRHTKIYEVWKTLKQRCFNPTNISYKNYGGRGITICEDWKNNFSSFYEWSMKNGYKEGLSIDRIDNNGNYCPENCRWTDRLTQANNTRTNHFITFRNQTKTIAEWARHFNLPYSNILAKLQKNNYDSEKAFAGLVDIN